MPLQGLSSVKKAIDKTRLDANKKLRKLYIKIYRNIILGTPVDTGRARANWFLTTGRASNQIIDSNRVSIVKGLRSMPKIVLDEKVYISNNLPYINELEFGSSKQAPDGWVRAELIRAKAEVRKL